MFVLPFCYVFVKLSFNFSDFGEESGSFRFSSHFILITRQRARALAARQDPADNTSVVSNSSLSWPNPSPLAVSSTRRSLFRSFLRSIGSPRVGEQGPALGAIPSPIGTVSTSVGEQDISPLAVYIH